MKSLLNNLQTLTGRRVAYLMIVRLAGLVLARVTPGAAANHLGWRPTSTLGKLIQRVLARVHRFSPATPSAPATVATQTVDVGTGGADVGRRISAAIVNGTPAMFYYKVSDEDLKFARHSTADGSGAWTITAAAR